MEISMSPRSTCGNGRSFLFSTDSIDAEGRASYFRKYPKGKVNRSRKVAYDEMQ